MERKELHTSKASIVDSDLIAFFDLLAQFDYEDKKREESAPKTDPLSAPGGQF